MFDVVIPLEVAMYLYDYLTEPTEVAGKFIVTEYRLKYFDEKHIPIATLGFPTKSEVVGQRSSVMPPSGFFNFHTHPYHCYKDFNLTLNWPSGRDMGYVFMLREQGNMIHFVITVEGIYGVQLSAQLNLYLKMMKKKNYMNYDECIFAAYNTVVTFFEKFAIDACVDPDGAKNMLLQYIDAVNTFTFEDITRNMLSTACNWVTPVSNFKAFNFKFMSWEDIKAVGAFKMTNENIVFENEKCPPSFGDELEAIATGQLVGNID